ncbi:hypothetical protein OG898_28290 [Streptomyces sp. NBC_00193]|uniref:hypothetical protein n=1 Tax=Streptomyces sp. NBC_00193 TaxID=2975675 RepID=UPI00225139F4|nr:hypothetical protein [Streptomyces sp. NBC_00193]MCX5300336.1 hypothetical protein [Streptomyces sp. NBC_00193]
MNREARGQVISGVKVVQKVDTTSSAGHPQYEIDYVVLESGLPSGQGVQRQAERMRTLGWDVSGDESAGFTATSSRLNGLATFTPLRDYLADANPALSEVDTKEKLRTRFGDGGDLVLVTLQPLDPRN